MTGQYSLFDIHTEKLKPCHYRFQRYMGQKVKLHIANRILVGKIIEIDKYYTMIEVDGRTWAGTPTNVQPVEGSET